MSSGFVSSGTADDPTPRDAEWMAAQASLEATRRAKADALAANSTGKSLYETLEANKASKQLAFEEAARLKHQFRPLDEDEIEFLDEVLESTRREEQRVKRETEEGLEAFRRRREEAERVNLETAQVGEPDEENGEFEFGGGGRKRKRGKEKEGVALRGLVKGKRNSETATVEGRRGDGLADGDVVDAAKVESGKTIMTAAAKAAKSTLPPIATPAAPPPLKKEAAPAPTKRGMALVDYGSDGDDEED